jgi:hypothetical protein
MHNSCVVRSLTVRRAIPNDHRKFFDIKDKIERTYFLAPTTLPFG